MSLRSLLILGLSHVAVNQQILVDIYSLNWCAFNVLFAINTPPF